MICNTCGLPISKTDRTEKSGDGFSHKICFDISVTNLACELQSFMRAHPEEFQELPNGKFRSVSEPA